MVKTDDRIDPQGPAMNREDVFVYLKLLLTAIFWGGTFIAGRVVTRHMGPFSAAFLRFTVASAFLVVLARRFEGRWPVPGRGYLIATLLLGMTGVFSYNACFFTGLAHVQAGRASLIVATNPIFITLLSALIFKEKLTWIKGVGVALSVLGAMVVISRGHLTEILSGGFGRGEMFILGCVASWVAYSLIGKAAMKGMTPLSAVAGSAVVGTCALFFPAVNEGVLNHLASFSILDWAALFYLGFFGTVVGFVWYYQGIRHIGPMKASLFINFVPISAILLGWALLGEQVTLSLLAGAVLVSTGVYLTNSVKTRRELPEAAAAAKPARG